MGVWAGHVDGTSNMLVGLWPMRKSGFLAPAVSIKKSTSSSYSIYHL